MCHSVMNVDWNFYSVSVHSLGACILLSHHLLCAGIDKDSGAMKLQNEPKQEKGRKEKREKGLKSKMHHRDLEKVEPVHKKRKYDNGGELSHHLLCAGIDKDSGAMKLQNEPKQEKGRKEKKEKREKGLKSQKHHRDLEKVEPVHKKRKYDNGGELCEKKISKLVMEPLENSDLSEEHGLPSSIPVPCESWESTQSSKSRKLKHGTAFAPTRSHGSIILRIKLPLQKHKSQVPETSCGVPVLECKDPQPVSSNDLVLNEQNVPECAPANEEPCFSGQEAPSRVKDGKIAHGRSGSRKSKRRSKSEEMRMQIRDLISDWKPAQLQDSESDQGWLFERQQYKDPCARDCGLESTVEDISSEKVSVASYQPRACFMPEFNTYQMPYVFPF